MEFADSVLALNVDNDVVEACTNDEEHNIGSEKDSRELNGAIVVKGVGVC